LSPINRKLPAPFPVAQAGQPVQPIYQMDHIAANVKRPARSAKMPTLSQAALQKSRLLLNWCSAIHPRFMTASKKGRKDRFTAATSSRFPGLDRAVTVELATQYLGLDRMSSGSRGHS